MSKLDPVTTFLDWAARQPDHPAVIQGAETITYGELAHRVRCLAADISRRGSHPKVLVCLPQGADAYAAMLASLMAGGVYCPVNLEAPKARNNLILKSFSPDVVIAEPGHQIDLGDVDLCWQMIFPNLKQESELECPRTSAELAYVIFTSGSTGIPKGVMISRDAMMHYLAWAVPVLGMTPTDRCTQHPNIGFDLSVIDIYATLCSGATLVPLNSRKYRLMPAEAVRDHEISVWVSVPSVVDLIHRARQLSTTYLGSLRRLFFCGEPLLESHLEMIFTALPDVLIINSYGPTEGTVSCTELILTRENFRGFCCGSASLGRAIPGMGIDLVGGDHADEGEIVIWGPQVAKGYWNDTDRTANAFRRLDGRIAYHTGDWAVREDNLLYFRQRVDNQIKINGNRLELGDVDAALRTLGISASCTVYTDGRLISFIEATSHVNKQDLVDRLSDLLPRYAIPSDIRVTTQLPRSVNDKIDMLALKERVKYG
ncbi:MAG: AMP-binding protein [Gammaproteobacteria bacterium]